MVTVVSKYGYQQALSSQLIVVPQLAREDGKLLHVQTDPGFTHLPCIVDRSVWTKKETGEHRGAPTTALAALLLSVGFHHPSPRSIPPKFVACDNGSYKAVYDVQLSDLIKTSLHNEAKHFWKDFV